MTIAALEATLRLYRDPDRLAERLPTLRLLTRTAAELRQLAGRVAPALAEVLGARAAVSIEPCRSQIGSGSLPVDRLESVCLAVGPAPGARGRGGFPDRLAAALRELPVPVLGRIEDGRLRLDLRCLEDEQAFVAQLPALKLPDAPGGAGAA